MDIAKDIDNIEIYNQYDGKFPILVPDYKDKQYLISFQKLKTLIQREEYTATANYLAELVLNKLASNYNGWYVKRMCFEKGILDLQTQLTWTRAFLFQNVKNFQGWEYRRFLIEKRNQIGDQLDYVDKVLEIQEKNYHVWSYKVQITQKFNLYQQQKIRIVRWIDQDLMNNSAWSYRHFLFVNTLKSHEELQKQLQFAFSYIKKNINNLAVWNYLRGWFPSIKLTQFSNKKSGKELIYKYQEFPNVLQFCLQLAKDDENAVEAMITLIHIHSQKPQTLQYALSICEVLANKQTFKETYWKWIHRNLKQHSFKQEDTKPNINQESQNLSN